MKHRLSLLNLSVAKNKRNSTSGLQVVVVSFEFHQNRLSGYRDVCIDNTRLLSCQFIVK